MRDECACAGADGIGVQDDALSSLASISPYLEFGAEPDILTSAFARREIPGYDV